MKTVLFRRHGNSEVLEYTDFPDPIPNPGQVRVRLHAAALNRMDVMVRNGWQGLKLELPHINGADGAGVVELVGEGVEGFQTGKRVAINANLGCGTCESCVTGRDNMCKDWHLLGETVRGTYTELICLPARQLYPLPEGFDFHSAAAAALVYQTAWHSMVKRGKVSAGETVVVIGAGGGVNTACIALAKYLGARVIVVGSSEEKLQKAEALGADILINRTRETEWSKSIYLATDRNGAEVVIDNIGSTFPQSLRALRKGGRMLTVGNSASPFVELDNRYIFARHLSIIGSTMSTLADFKEVMDLVVAGSLPSVIDKTYPLSDAAAAQDRIWNGENFGKITLDIP